MQIIYRTERLLLCPFTEEDMNEDYQQWMYDQEVTKYNSHGLFPYSEKDRQSFIASLCSENKIVWGICVKNKSSKNKSKPVLIGNLSLQSINWINRSAEFAIVIGKKGYWGQSYGYEAANILFCHGFQKLNLNRIWTGTVETNMGMRKLAIKLGMKQEGSFREGMFLEGFYIDVICYGILREEFDRNHRR